MVHWAESAHISHNAPGPKFTQTAFGLGGLSGVSSSKHLASQTPDHSCTKQENLLRKWTQPPGAGANIASDEEGISRAHKNQQYCVCCCCLPRWFWMNPASSEPWLWVVLFHSVLVLMMNAGCLKSSGPSCPRNQAGKSLPSSSVNCLAFKCFLQRQKLIKCCLGS